MSLLKAKLKGIIPGKAWIFLKTYNPQNLFLKLQDPVVQIYLNDGKTETHLGINDYYSFLLAESKISSVCLLNFYDQFGIHVLKLKIALNPLEAMSLSVKDIFLRHSIISEYGLVTLQIKPHININKSFKRLGASASHFFVFYKDKNQSISHVHPSSILDKDNKASGDFISNQLISSKNLEGITLYQSNPTIHETLTTHSLLNGLKFDDAPLMKFDTILPALGVKKIHFPIKKHNDIEFYGIKVSPLPSSNSKPMLRREYKDGLFSMSHS